MCRSRTCSLPIASESRHAPGSPEVPPALLRVAESHGIDWARSLLLDLEFDFPGMASLTGSLLTDTERFIDFELETDSSYCQLLSIECWEDVTAQHDHGLHNRGTGKGYATIALETRRELLGLPYALTVSIFG
ncbi:MAG: hypothetical protein H5U33_02645, partial [Pseudomonas sp.]|nr:hypothetical protein [Pseudomonas sp.]